MDKRVDAETMFRLNGRDVRLAPRVGERLSEALRERLGARDVKVGCNAGDCGACTVLVDGAPVCACLMPAQQAAGAEVETLAGLVAREPLAAELARRFEGQGAAQCGICTPGMMVSAVALLREAPRPSEGEVMDALGGVLCRCTGYRKIIDAVMGRAPGAVVDADGHMGAAIEKLDGRVKVTGAERFGDDVATADALVIKVIRSPHAHARFVLGDLDEFATREGVEAVLTASDVPGVNLFGTIPGFVDQPVFAEGVARFRGEAVAAVVGTAEVMAQFDPARFPVEWEILPDVQGMVEAMAQDAPQLHSGRAGNVMCGGFVAHGDVGAGAGAGACRGRGRVRDRVRGTCLYRARGRVRAGCGGPGRGACLHAGAGDGSRYAGAGSWHGAVAHPGGADGDGRGVWLEARCVGAALSGDCRAQDRATGADHL